MREPRSGTNHEEDAVLHNLFVDVMAELEDSIDVRLSDALDSMGDALRLSHEKWYVRSELGAREAAERLASILASHASAFVIDCSTNQVALLNVDAPVAEYLEHHWHQERTRCDSASHSIEAFFNDSRLRPRSRL